MCIINVKTVCQAVEWTGWSTKLNYKSRCFILFLHSKRVATTLQRLFFDSLGSTDSTCHLQYSVTSLTNLWGAVWLAASHGLLFPSSERPEATDLVCNCTSLFRDVDKSITFFFYSYIVMAYAAQWLLKMSLLLLPNYTHTFFTCPTLKPFLEEVK